MVWQRALDLGGSVLLLYHNQRKHCLALSFDNTINRHHEESMKLKALNQILLENFYGAIDRTEEIGDNPKRAFVQMILSI